MKNYTIYLFLLIFLLSCKKEQEWLDVKSDKADLIPSKIEDFQALLDNDSRMNERYPAIGILGSDNYYLTESMLDTRSLTERNSYLWNEEIFPDGSSNDWFSCYVKIANANIVLEGLGQITGPATGSSQYNNVKGAAYFFRASAFYALVQLFADQYAPATAQQTLGLPLRLSSDVNLHIQRGNLQQTYDQILSDLNQAELLLEDHSIYKTRPTKVSVKALLAKAWLHIGDFQKSYEYANQAIELFSGNLLDFNLLEPSARFPMPIYKDNPEIVFYGTGTSYTALYNHIIDPLLYDMYETNDLRKAAFYGRYYNNSISFKGFYTARNQTFCGIALNELYLIKAESLARLNRKDEAMGVLNMLLVKRYKADGTFVPKTAADSKEALTLILKHRRLELPFTGSVRWEDLRRLNKEPEFAVTLNRTVNGQIYTLQPNSKRYTYPIPGDEVRLGGVQQNER